MTDWNECEEYNERKQRKLEQKTNAFIANRACKMTHILLPHRHELKGDIFGRNDLHKLAVDRSYNKEAWPPYQPSPLVLNKPNPIETFYKPLLEKMCDAYFEYAFKKHDYMGYSDIKKLPQFDISSLTKDTQSFTETNFKTTKSDKDIAEKYGPEIFSPCIPEYVIRLNRYHVLYVKIIENQDDILTIRFDDYVMQGKKISCIYRIILASKYNEDTQEMEWNAQECIPYEDFLMKDVKDMNWTAEEQQLWFDAFGVYPFDSPAVIRVPITFDTDDTPLVDLDLLHEELFFVYKKEDAEWIVKESKHIMPKEAEIIESGASVITHKRQTCIEENYPKCLIAIALVNIQFIKNGITAINPDENMSSITIGNMIVRTKTPIRTSLKIQGGT